MVSFVIWSVCHNPLPSSGRLQKAAADQTLREDSELSGVTILDAREGREGFCLARPTKVDDSRRTEKEAKKVRKLHSMEGTPGCQRSQDISIQGCTE